MFDSSTPTVPDKDQIKREYLSLLICPICHSSLVLKENGDSDSLQQSLTCTSNGHQYAIRNGIPRFVASGNYAESFGFQWLKFSTIQLDSYNGTNFSEERFRLITGWSQPDLEGKLILDAGCGAGRFSEVVLKYGGQLVAFDLSEAVEACRNNLLPAEPLICQASVYELPFRPGGFDFVYCIGVVQHTPNPESTVRALSQMVKPGGKIGLWIYESDWKSYVGTVGFKYAFRPFLRRFSRAQIFTFSKRLVDLFFPVASYCKSRGFLGKVIMRLLPIASAYLQSVQLSDQDFKTWVLLDTFDMYSPTYDFPQTYEKIASLLTDLGFDNIQRQPHGGISITATRRM